MSRQRAVSFLKSSVGKLFRRARQSKAEPVLDIVVTGVKCIMDGYHCQEADCLSDSASSGYSSSEDEFCGSCSDLTCPLDCTCPCYSPVPKPPSAFASPTISDISSMPTPSSSSASQCQSCSVRASRVSVVSSDSGFGECPVPRVRAIKTVATCTTSSSCSATPAPATQGQVSPTGANGETFCQAFDSHLSLQSGRQAERASAVIDRADTLPAANTNIRVAPTSPEMTLLTHGSRSGAAKTSSSVKVRAQPVESPAVGPVLDDRNALRCFAVSVWCRLSQSLQSRLDARDIAEWLQASEEALFAAEWQREQVLDVPTLALLHLMVRKTLSGRPGQASIPSSRQLQTDGAHLKATILACLYVVCSYSGQEITYPMWPYLAAAPEYFWQLAIGLGLRFSRELLAMHADRSQFDDEVELMAAFAHVDLRQCRSKLPKQAIPSSVGELLLEEMREDQQKQELQQRRKQQQQPQRQQHHNQAGRRQAVEV